MAVQPPTDPELSRKKKQTKQGVWHDAMTPTQTIH